MLKAIVAVALLSALFVSGGEAPQPPVNAGSALPESPRLGWARLLERIRLQPRADELRNGPLAAHVSELFPSPEVGPETAGKVKIIADYDKALLAMAARWETELCVLRAECDAKLIAALPEESRERAQAVLTLSRQKWQESMDRDMKLRSEYFERMRSAPRPASAPATPAGAPALAAQAAAGWMREERAKISQQDLQTAKDLRALLKPEEAERLDRAGRARLAGNSALGAAVPAMPKAGLRGGPAQPPAAVPAAATPAVIPPSAPAAVQPTVPQPSLAPSKPAPSAPQPPAGTPAQPGNAPAATSGK